MSSLVYLVPLALLLGGGSLVAFLWTVRGNQYEDLKGASERIFVNEAGDQAEAQHTHSPRQRDGEQ
ncbi:MAG: cbb3-type cytochrome oxidase assembly protein CcoS [Proteobacteria bacterium]|nr:cbb3-type cytochrome oxidase assembly protein CcoS [Pseudomonadota bacterium]